MVLLWNPESWSQRLAELEAQSGDLKEAPLHRDVRSLGTLLGSVLREQAGISPEMAIRIGKLCGNGPDLWISMQQAHDLWRAQQKLIREIKRIPTLDPAA